MMYIIKPFIVSLAVMYAIDSMAQDDAVVDPEQKPEQIVKSEYIGLGAQIYLEQDLIITSLDGKDAVIPAGDYLVELTDVNTILLQNQSGEPQIEVKAELIGSGPEDSEGMAYISVQDGKTWLRYTQVYGDTYRVPVDIRGVQPRSTYVWPADLRVSWERAPSVIRHNDWTGYRVRVYNQGPGRARNFNVRIQSSIYRTGNRCYWTVGPDGAEGRRHMMVKPSGRSEIIGNCDRVEYSWNGYGYALNCSISRLDANDRTYIDFAVFPACWVCQGCNRNQDYPGASQRINVNVDNTRRVYETDDGNNTLGKTVTVGDADF